MCLVGEDPTSDERKCLSDDYKNKQKKKVQARLIGLKASLTDQCEILDALDEEIVNSLEPENVEKYVLESMKILKPMHKLLASVSLKLSSNKINDSENSSAGVEITAGHRT